MLAGVTIDGGQHGAALFLTLVVTTVVIGLARIGALSGAGGGPTIPDRSGLPARAPEVSS